MLSRERQKQMLQHVRARGSGNVSELAVVLGVSPSTVRRDLSDLSDRGLLTRVHGGAAIAEDQVEAQRAARASVNSDQKRRIGQAAAAGVMDGSTVLITGGTTTDTMLPFLAHMTRLTVLTNGLTVAVQLSQYEGVSVVVLGGVVRPGELSLLGPIAEQSLTDFHVDAAFCGVFGIDAHGGVSGADVHEVRTDRQLLASADELIVLADASKFHQRGPVRLIDIDRVDRLITDAAAPPSAVSDLRARGVRVLVV